jgi:hypothetical protein
MGETYFTLDEMKKKIKQREEICYTPTHTHIHIYTQRLMGALFLVVS